MNANMKNRECSIKIDHNQNNHLKNNDISLMEKFRLHYKERENIQNEPLRFPTRLMYAMMAFQTPTQIYMTVFYIIPAVFYDYTDWTQYCLKVIYWFCCLQAIANYFCVILYDTTFKRTRDRPNLSGLCKRWENSPDYFVSFNHASENGHAVQETQSESGMSWQYCSKCEMYVPPRSHHCRICRKCILKRDHHCFFVGKCIGFKNQRYFVVLAFYGILCGFGGGLLTYSYLQLMFSPISYSWTDYLFPFAIYRWLSGTTNMTGHYVLLIYHLWTELFYGIFGFIYFTGQIGIFYQGVTLFEYTKKLRVKNSNNFNERFRSVFGDFWALNFLFPMQIIFRQTEDGTKWDGVKLDYNANHMESAD